MKVEIYARVSTHDQQTLKLQLEAMRKYAQSRKWVVTLEIRDIGAGASERPKREELLQATRRREIDSILVWKLDRWGRSLPDLVLTLRELKELGVAFVSLTEALDLSTPTCMLLVCGSTGPQKLRRSYLKIRYMLRNSLKRIKRGIVLGAAVLGCGGAVFSFIQKADAALMLDWVVGSDGVIYDEAYRALGSTFNQQGKLLSFRVLVPGVGTGQRNTSATFLNQWYALTAAHNVRDLLQYNPTYEVATGDNYLTNRGDVYPVESVTMFPGYDGTLWTPDIAIIRFAQPILDFSENTIGSASPGDVVTAAGYGWSATQSVRTAFRDGAARGWEAVVWDRAPHGNISSVFYTATTFGFYNDGLLLNGAGLSGDSGGPVFNAFDQLVGIIAAGTGIGYSSETSHLNLTDPTIYSWILENTSVDTPVAVPSVEAIRRSGTARRIR